MKSKFSPYWALIICNSVWALDYPLYTIIMPKYISPLAMSTSAIVMAAIGTLIALLFVKGEKVDRKDIPQFIIAGALVGIGRKFFLMSGMSLTSPIDGSIIGTMTPVLVLLTAVIVGRDRFTPKKITGLLLGMSGAIAIILTTGKSVHDPHIMLGNLYVLVCVLCSAVYTVLFKNLMMKYNIWTVMRWFYCSAAIMILPFGIKPIIETDYAAMTHAIKYAYLFALLIPTLMPNLLLVYGLKYLSATVSSIYAYLQPIIATIIAVSFHMDTLHIATVAAAAVIFSGVYLVIGSYNLPKTDSPK